MIAAQQPAAEPRQRPARRAGFTLIELLVVLGVIAVIVSITLTSLRGARESARRTQCLSNLKQLGAIVQVVMNEEQGLLPYCLSSAEASSTGLARSIGPFFTEKAGTTEVLRCPADPAASDARLSNTLFTSYDYWPGQLMLAHEVARLHPNPRQVVTQWYDRKREWPVFIDKAPWHRSKAGLGRQAVYYKGWHADWVGAETTQASADDDD